MTPQSDYYGDNIIYFVDDESVQRIWWKTFHSANKKKRIISFYIDS